MVLTLEEYRQAKEANDEKLKCLFRLRESTNLLVIQCLADREIQCCINKAEKHSSQAYRYNCAIVHNPHRVIQIKAVQLHGWNEKRNKPTDQNLWLGRLLGKNPSNSNHLNIIEEVQGPRLEQINSDRVLISTMKTTIQKLQEELQMFKGEYKTMCLKNIRLAEEIHSNHWKDENARRNDQIEPKNQDITVSLAMQCRIQELEDNLRKAQQEYYNKCVQNNDLRAQISEHKTIIARLQAPIAERENLTRDRQYTRSRPQQFYNSVSLHIDRYTSRRRDSGNCCMKCTIL